MHCKSLALLALIVPLSACTALESSVTTSSFATPDMMGAFSGDLTDERGGSERVAEGGFAYRVGFEDMDGVVAQAGLFSDTDVGDAVAFGPAVYQGTYEIASIIGIQSTTNEITGFTGTGSGPMTLTVDFDSGTFGGSGMDLNIGGAIEGTEMTGTATYAGVSGSMVGEIGADTAIGAFHGNDDEAVFAGGFIVTAQ